MKVTDETIDSPSPGCWVAQISTGFIRVRRSSAVFDMLCLHLQLVRVWPGPSGGRMCLIFRASDYLQIGLSHVVDCQQRPTPELVGAAVVKICRGLVYKKYDKRTPTRQYVLHLRTVTIQATTAREIEGRVRIRRSLECPPFLLMLSQFG